MHDDENTGAHHTDVNVVVTARTGHSFPVVMRIGFQGVDGAYSHIAAQRRFPNADELLGAPSFRAMLDALQRGDTDYAVLPVENTTAGSIYESYDLLASSGVAVVGEIIEHVDHCLIGLEGATLEGLVTVYSHPQALAQCAAFLEAQCIEPIAFPDTAQAADKIAADGDPTHGAIGSAEAARLRGLPILARRIADQPGNYTRMVVVAREPETPTEGTQCKTSLIFRLAHQHGALAECLQVLAKAQLNLTKIESRPILGEPWEYLFYLDFEGPPDVGDILRALAPHTRSLKVLGSYVADTLPE